MIEIHSFSEYQTRKAGAKIAEEIIQENKKESKTKIILLFGNLGSGKTAFVKGFAGKFNIKKILSPTFSITKSYKLSHKKYLLLCHTDLYRVKSIKELDIINFFGNLKTEKTIHLIEWPELIEQDVSGIKIYFDYGDKEKKRIISYDKL